MTALLYCKAKYHCFFVAIIDGIVSAQNTHLVALNQNQLNDYISLDGCGIIGLSYENFSAINNICFNSEVFKG